eukprot:TRINITY_DN2206_c0_g1_i1.p1 TRINITY_DN2206_c0_g1~~TRINITY_DN2206_c0_g1_i1.p1  ORF type:complete len:420 (-),score=80.47 TRINITY_DN2206_c0_g1_i1:15-1274(-)
MQSKSNSCFSHHNIFMKENGDIYAFGNNSMGQCGTGDFTDIKTPTKIMNNPKIKSIVLGEYSSFFIEENGDLYACGNSLYKGIKDSNEKTPNFVFFMSDVKQIFCSNLLTIIQKKNGKIIWCGNIEDQIISDGYEELDIDNVDSFSCGSDHILFFKANGEVWVMGSNSNGQCGLNDDLDFIKSPLLLMSDKNIKAVCCGWYYSYILLRDEKGVSSLKVFGSCEFGQLGLGECDNQCKLSTIFSFPNISSIHCSSIHAILLMENGDVYSCGYNVDGQLGLGINDENVSNFTKIDLKDISHVTVGDNHSVFVNRNKEIFVCGKNDLGQLGLGDNNSRISPCRLEFLDLHLIHNNEFLTVWSKNIHKSLALCFRRRIFVFFVVFGKNLTFHSKFSEVLYSNQNSNTCTTNYHKVCLFEELSI